ncbi:hypothetical protein HD554DRAFT_936096 [Boletus coccyginus]|nr:hypothetical protein HD554DRAFT_936096 [Boletus coccyginus]
MHAFPSLASLALLAATVHASIYVTNPVQSSSCTGGQPCEVDWVDNGAAPLVSQIGVCEVGLYTGEYVLAQSLPSVDVSSTSSLTFTVDPAAGPNGQYYLVFSADGISYDGFSGSFTLTGMTGTTPGGSTTPTDTSTASAPTTTPTSSVSATDTTATGTSSTSPTETTTTGTATTHSTTTTTTSKTTSASPSATTTSAAGRVGSSTSFGAVAALLALSGILAF